MADAAGPLLPPALKRGDTIAVVAPSRTSAPDCLDGAARYLESRGLRVRRARNVHDRYHYLAGDDAGRAAGWMEAFLDDDVAGLLCARGGFGSGRILDRLDFEAIAARPKAVVGFSDSTGLHLALWARTRLVGFTGALADTDLGRGAPEPLLEDTLWRLLQRPQPLGEVPAAVGGLRTWRSGTAAGALVPANLALLCSLLGTPYAPELAGAVLLLEDVSEHPYRIDRMLTQLRLAGVLDRIAGLALGTFVDCFRATDMEDSPTLEEIVLDAVADRDLPVVAGVEYGHTRRRAVLPVGVTARLTADAHGASLTVTEAATRG